jgi:hypothetical protein
VTVDDLDLEFARATTIQKVRREAQTRPLFYHAIRHLMRYYLEERDRFLEAIGKKDVRALWITDDGEPLTPDRTRRSRSGTFNWRRSRRR